jgi:hypothetical protein
MLLISGSNAGKFHESHPLVLCIDDKTTREEGNFADKFYDRTVQKHTVTRWKAALERLRVGIILRFSLLFSDNLYRARKAGQ